MTTAQQSTASTSMERSLSGRSSTGGESVAVAPSGPVKQLSQRNRPGILSRQASEREDAESARYLHSASASEDDDGRQSDSGSLPRRFATNNSSASSSLRNSTRNQLPPSPFSPGYGSGIRSTSSGGEASASSSRSHLPLQSKTSLYSRQASNESTKGCNYTEDGGPTSSSITFGSDQLSRAKSVSSVSSVNSTSSMEAVPFRAAPLGNTRVGYAGYGTRRNGTAMAPPKRNRGSPQGTVMNSEGTSANENTDSNGNPLPDSLGKQRILPKGPSDEWQYRNAPGMGARTSGGRNNLHNYHTIVVPRNIERSGLSSAVETNDIDERDGRIAISNRIKPSIRSKLAKRAGKLGLKPLTNMAMTNGSDYSLPGTMSYNFDHNLSLASVDVNSFTVSSVSVPSISLSPTQRLSPESTFRATKSYFSSSSFSGASHTNLAPDGEMMLRTSSVTYAPLVVQKNPPGPPGSGPPPSPGLTGLPSPYHPFALASPQVSPRRIVDDVDPLTMVRDKLSPDQGKNKNANDQQPTRPKRGSFSGLLGNLQLGDMTQRHSLPVPAKETSPTSVRPASSVITPAQQIQKDVRDGVARAPAEPSGSTPGPNPNVETNQRESEVEIITTRSPSTRVESDFLFGDILGEGSYSTVMEAWDLKPLRERGISVPVVKAESNAMGALVGKKITAKQRANVEGAKIYAIKVLDKVHILKEKKQKYVGVEREALSLLIRHPGVITLYWTFQDRESLCEYTENS